MELGGVQLSTVSCLQNDGSILIRQLVLYIGIAGGADDTGWIDACRSLLGNRVKTDKYIFTHTRHAE